MTALVVLTLTGFSTGRGRGGGDSDGGGGGGCSSSSQDHDSSSSSGGSSSGGSSSGKGRYDDDDDYEFGGSGGTSSGTGGSSGSSGSGSGRKDDVVVELVSCAGAKADYATVKLTNRENRTAKFPAGVAFEDRSGILLTSGSEVVELPAKGTRTVRIAPDDLTRLDEIAKCELEELVDRY